MNNFNYNTKYLSYLVAWTNLYRRVIEHNANSYNSNLYCDLTASGSSREITVSFRFTGKVCQENEVLKIYLKKLFPKYGDEFINRLSMTATWWMFSIHMIPSHIDEMHFIDNINKERRWIEDFKRTDKSPFKFFIGNYDILYIRAWFPKYLRDIILEESMVESLKDEWIWLQCDFKYKGDYLIPKISEEALQKLMSTYIAAANEGLAKYGY